MTITPADFKARFTEFASVEDTRVQLFIDDAELEMSESAWGNIYDKGLAYLTAHLLTISDLTASGNSGSLNALASRAVDGVSESFATPTMDDNNNIASTSYGQEYARLLRLIGRGAYVV